MGEIEIPEVAENDSKKESADVAANKKWKLQFGMVLPVVALLLSLFSLFSSEMARKDAERVDVIKSEYGLYHDLAQLQVQYPNLEHLLTLTSEAYDSTVNGIRTASSSLSEQERARLLLQERALAHYIFTTYEETFYVWKEAEGKDSRRASLSRDDLTYFDELLCGNPRLLWYWDKRHGGQLAREFGDDFGLYLATTVVKNCQTGEDPTGPFGH